MIVEKRNSLEIFIQEQIIGPGGCNYQYSVKHDNEQIPDSSMSFGEVLNTTPGQIYSSAILFPLKDSECEEGEIDIDTQEEDTDDLDSLGRRFPNRFGISCCLDAIKANDNLNIKVSGRYYRKVKSPLSIRIKIEDEQGFISFLGDEIIVNKLGKIVEVESGNIKLVRKISTDDLKNINDNLREINRYFCSLIASNPDGTICSVYTDPTFKSEYKYLSSYKERLFAALNHFDLDGNYTSAGKEDEIKERIYRIEKYETYISYIEDAISVFNTRGYGFWEAVNFSKDIDLSQIDITSKRIFKADDYPSLKDVVKVEIASDVFLSLDVWLQSIKRDDRLYLKVLLVNSSTPIQKDDVTYFSIVTEKVNERSFFGVSLDISSPHLLEYHKLSEYEATDQEANSLRFLYRGIKDYGTGHLCSADWGCKDGIMHVWSEFLPKYETPDVEPMPRDKNSEEQGSDGKIYAKRYMDDPKCLQFKWLSAFSKKYLDNPVSDEQIRKGLLEFVESYNKWIQALPIHGNVIASENKRKCEQDYNRMKNNILEFLSVPEIMSSFRLMNAAMFMQLWHSKENNRKKVINDEAKLTFDYYRDNALDTTIFPGMVAAWRPFQLAFILLNLDGIFKSKNDPEWKHRNELVDLVWFPTGGGKTEAYLGIIALTIINRRITHKDKGYGIAAIMRYTLRLLTTQQFQRAFRLIASLEQIRLWGKEYGLGEQQISIGLYVGNSSLPNTNKDLVEEVQNWDKTHGKVPLDICPICGSAIKPINSCGEQQFRCSNHKCTFGRRSFFPVRLCDEHIYSVPPTLLFGTVDKFAQMAHKVDAKKTSDSRRLFQSDNCLPPDLIIQDELHLLLGPLGSAVSLFECAVDQLCSYKDDEGKLVRPKIISSTATTRNTTLQIRALYDRGVSIFPKNGVDYDDSFFAFYKRYKNDKEEEWKYIAKRKYLGVLPTGRTQMTTQMRLASILFVHRALFELANIKNINDKDYQKAADYYYTVISYFNSLKEVGKTDAQFHQEFTKYTRRLFKRVMRFSNMHECLYVYNDHFSKTELTGRLTGEEAVKELKNAEKRSWNLTNRLPYIDSDGKWHHAQLPADMILATNMISVGLDVSRFNTIIMNSMPRNIAEYIQASSRVARDKEGLVITLHNPFNQRDVSHFEKFREFHEKLYFYVEPISITPFSPKSVERFLPLYLAAIIRHKYVDLGGRKEAKNINNDIARILKNELKKYFEDREKRSELLSSQESALLTPEMLAVIKRQIDKCINIWQELADRKGQNLVYYISKHGRRDPYEISLFASPEDFEGESPDDKWLVPNALRVIEPESVIHVIK